MVLNMLLSLENREYTCAVDEYGAKLSVTGLLRLSSAQHSSLPMRVLIDVGAYVLEMNNRALAEEWLKIVDNAEAALYFDPSDEAMILERSGHTCRLVPSPFRDKLGNVLVYLDEVHTRGIDLSIPLGARAAVTLGPRLSKDRLVQACMRLRKLGHGHSLAFFAPPEVHQNILGTVGKHLDRSLDSADVVQWATEQTCQIAQSSLPLWVAQGTDFIKRARLCEELLDRWETSKVLAEATRINKFWDSIQEPEAQSLRDMYGADTRIVARKTSCETRLPDHPFTKQLEEVWETLDPTFANDSAANEEQERELAPEVERELAPEVERERHVQKAPPASARHHQVHEAVRSFVSAGTVQAPNAPIQFAFDTLRRISAGEHFEAKSLCPQLRVTTDFVDTVQLKKKAQIDEFLRPVHWVLASTTQDVLLLISPFEANEL